MSISIDVKMYHPRETAERICNSDQVGLFLAETCARHMMPYVPMDTGVLSQTYTTDPFKVTYTSIYAHYQYEGTNFNFSKEQHPLATSHWDKAMIVAKRGTIAQEVTDYLRRLG